MTPAFVRGPIANVFTCFDAGGALDEAGQRAFLDFLLDQGSISALFVRSGMGQMYTYSYDEVERMVRLAVDQSRGMPVLAGTTGIWDRNFDRRPNPETFLRQAEELTRTAEESGAAGTVHTMPEAIAPGEDETPADVTLRYFERICEAAEKPVFLYQPPPTTPPYHMTPELAARLADLPAMAGMKLSTGDAGYLLDIAWATREANFALICGNEAAFYAGLHCGAKAVIGQGCCVNPAVLLAVHDRFDAGDMAGAMEAQVTANRLVREAPPAVSFMKRYAAEKGYAVPPYSRAEAAEPYGPGGGALDDAVYAAFKATLEREVARYR